MGDIAKLNNATVTVVGNSQATIIGSGNTISGNNGASITVGGNGSTSADSAIDTVNASGATITITDNSRVNVFGSNDVVSAGTSDNFGVFGSNNTINASAGDGVWVGGNGSTGAIDTVNASGAAVTVANNSHVKVNNTSATLPDTVYCGTGDSVDLYGGGYTVYAGVADHIFLSGTMTSMGAKPDTVIVSGDVPASGNSGGIFLDNNVQANISGSNNAINLGTGDTVGVGGGGNIISNAGERNHLWLTGANTNTVFASNLLGGLSADGQGSGIWMDNNAHVSVFGGNDYFVAGTGVTLDLINTSPKPMDILVGSQDTINAMNLQLTVFGSNDRFYGNGYDLFKIQGTYDPVWDSHSRVDYYGGNFTGDPYMSGIDDFTYYHNESLNTMGMAAGTMSFSSTSLANPVPTTSQAIILNLKGEAVQTSALATSKAYFDIENSGTQIQTAWGTAGEGILIYDPNNKHVVKEGASLVKGFTALSLMDSNYDRKIDSQDDVWNQLKVWVDKTGSGKLEPGTLYSLDKLGITSIDLDVANVNQDNNGNRIIHYGSFYKEDGSKGDIAGVDLAYDRDTVEKTAKLAASTTFVPSTPVSAAGSLDSLIQSMAAFTDGSTGIDQNFSLSAANDESPLIAADLTKQVVYERHAYAYM